MSNDLPGISVFGMNINLPLPGIAVLGAYFLIAAGFFGLDIFAGRQAFRRSERLIDLCIYSLSQQLPLVVLSILEISANDSRHSFEYIIWIQAGCAAATLLLYIYMQSNYANQKTTTSAHMHQLLTSRLLPGAPACRVQEFMQLTDYLIDADFLTRPNQPSHKAEKRRLFLEFLPQICFNKAGLTPDSFLVPESGTKSVIGWKYRIGGVSSVLVYGINLFLAYKLLVGPK